MTEVPTTLKYNQITTDKFTKTWQGLPCKVPYLPTLSFSYQIHSTLKYKFLYPLTTVFCLHVNAALCQNASQMMLVKSATYLLSNSSAIYFPFRQSVNDYYLFRGALKHTQEDKWREKHWLDTTRLQTEQGLQIFAEKTSLFVVHGTQSVGK